MKTLFAGIVLLLVLGIGGFLYRAEVENHTQTIACPVDAKMCPDGTSVGRVGSSCTFPACPPPNSSIDSLGIAFALPDGFTETQYDDPSVVTAYTKDSSASTTDQSFILVRSYALTGTSSPISVIQQTAIQGASGAPAPATAYSSATLGTHRFTVVSIERYEGLVDIAYYLVRGSDVLRFDAIDRGVMDWTNPYLDTASLPAVAALQHLLATLQGA